jgi:hypothetical protein
MVIACIMEPVSSSEASVNTYQIKSCNIPEHSYLQYENSLCKSAVVCTQTVQNHLRWSLLVLGVEMSFWMMC